jgi:hypothetical protein
MEKYLNGVTIPLAMSVAGGIIYVIYFTFRNTLDSVREKEVILIFFEILGICAGLKIVLLAFDPSICPNNEIDKSYLAIGGLMTVLVSVKDMVTKFKPPSH